MDAITTKIRPQSEQSRVFLGWADSKRRAWLFEKGLVLDETPLEDGAEFLVEWTEAQKVAFETMV